MKRGNLFTAFLLSISMRVIAQDFSQLPVLRTNKDTLTIRINNRKEFIDWIVNPELKPDSFQVYINKPSRIKFQSDISSLRKKIGVDETFDFLIVKDADTALTRIVSKKSLMPTKRQQRLAEKYNVCKKENRYMTWERSQIYPFSVADKVALISFESMSPNRPIEINIDSIQKNLSLDTIVNVADKKLQLKEDNDNNDTSFAGYIPMENSELVNSKIIEKQILSVERLEKLTDILYNIGPTPSKKPLTYELGLPQGNCYEPRNGIIFLDAHAKIKEFIEICFHCQRIEYSSNKFYIGQLCDDKFSLIKQFFIEEGINYGTKTKN